MGRVWTNMLALHEARGEWARVLELSNGFPTNELASRVLAARARAYASLACPVEAFHSLGSLMGRLLDSESACVASLAISEILRQREEWGQAHVEAARAWDHALASGNIQLQADSHFALLKLRYYRSGEAYGPIEDDEAIKLQ